ncbi:isoflavone 7-O-methyltransferase [Trifolium repens]|nr:isoflavone 7-O-methyltransferase [Trifolium repens]
MRLLAHNKVFTIVNIDDNKEAYALAPTSKLLVKGTNHCLSSMVHLITDPNIVDLYYQLSEWTSNEKLTIHETTFWDYYHQNPNHLKLMLEVRGTGNSAKIISEAFPTLKCIVFDLPNVVEGLTDNNYLSFVGGNMFESFLQADAILLKWILHDWNDDDCVKILKISKEAVLRENKGGKVIIIDIVINKEQDEHEMT